MSKEHPVVLVVNSSPRRNGMTATLARAALQGAVSEGARARLVHLVDEKLSSCRSCDGDCWTTLTCRHDPLAGRRASEMQEAEGLVMAVPVYCWQLNSLASLYIDKMRWNTGSVLQPRNARAALGIASAGGSGTGCVLGLQSLYRYFANWAFRGLDGIPVTRFNFGQALARSEEGGRSLVRQIRAGMPPFSDLGAAMQHHDRLPFMRWGLLDELAFVVRQISEGLSGTPQALSAGYPERARGALDLLAQGDSRAPSALAAAYTEGAALWGQLMPERP